ncbi:phosphatase PAP2 family protein [Pedococcus soli]
MSRRPVAAPRLAVPGALVVTSSRTPALAGAGVAAAALAGFAGLVDGVTENADLTSYDPGIASSVADLRVPGLTFAAEVVSTVGSEVAIGLLTVVTLALLWFVWRERARAVLFGATMAAAGVLTLGVKHLLGRHRPPAAFVVGPVDTGYSFPSGHTLFSTVFIGLVVMLVLWPRAHRRGRVAAVAAWALASAAIGASRVYLGYHWTTDVIAGWVLAVGVLGLALTVGSARQQQHDVRGSAHAGPAR